MQAMTTYGPDLNISLPERRRGAFDWERLQRRVNYYAAALVTFSLASPVGNGALWKPHGRQGYSLRTYRRSLYGPAVAYHPKERGRLEFKAFDMPVDRGDFQPFFLLWLWLLMDDDLCGEAEDQDRVYDLACAARFGWQGETIVERAEEALDRAPGVLTALDCDPAALDVLRERLQQRWLPAVPLIEHMDATESIPELLRFVDRLASAPEDCVASPGKT
jgi:carboxylate-amine ligase